MRPRLDQLVPLVGFAELLAKMVVAVAIVELPRQVVQALVEPVGEPIRVLRDRVFGIVVAFGGNG
jgi:hypothetical protein